jgi:hypothetical protein
MNWAHVQYAGTPTQLAGASSSVTLPSPPQPGDLLIACAVCNDTSGVSPTLSDTAGSAYYPIGHSVQTAGGSVNTSSSIWLFGASVPATASGSLTLTAVGHTSSSGLALDEFAATGAATIQTPAVTEAIGGGTAITAPTLTWPAGQLALDFACIAPSGYQPGTITPPSGYTLTGTQDTHSSKPGIVTLYKANDTGGSAAPGATGTNGTYWNIVAVALTAIPPASSAAPAGHEAADAAGWVAAGGILIPAALAAGEHGDHARSFAGADPPPGPHHRRPRWVPPIRRPTR